MSPGKHLSFQRSNPKQQATTQRAEHLDTMAAANEEVKLTGPKSWKAWNERFMTEAVTRNIWDLIDPKSTRRGQFKQQPTKPDISTYPKRLDRTAAPPAQSTRGNSASSTTASESPFSQLTEEVDRAGKPRNTSEMTALGRDAYKTDLSEYQFEWRLFDAESQKVNRLTAWVRQTVARQLYTTACKANKTLDQWYEALKERAGTDDREELHRALNKYNAAIKPLAKKPRDMLVYRLGRRIRHGMPCSRPTSLSVALPRFSSTRVQVARLEDGKGDLTMTQ